MSLNANYLKYIFSSTIRLYNYIYKSSKTGRATRSLPLQLRNDPLSPRPKFSLVSSLTKKKKNDRITRLDHLFHADPRRGRNTHTRVWTRASSRVINE